MIEHTVLALDLSSARGVIAVMKGDLLLFEASFKSERSHNAQVFAPLKQALRVIGDQPAVIAVGTGPGSYTGVRISIAAVQGIAVAKGWPVVAVASISTVNLDDYHVLGDARRGSFYTASVSSGQMTRSPEIRTAEQALAEISQGGHWISLDAQPPLIFQEIECYYPDAQHLARLVSHWTDERILRASSALLEPIYLQDAFITVAKKAGKTVPLPVIMKLESN